MSNCVICGLKGHAHKYFGAISCRACSAFFRRSTAERKVYRCHFKNKCVIKIGERKACRACRYKKCLEAGMSMKNFDKKDLNDQDTDDILVENEKILQNERILPNFSDVDIPSTCPNLIRAYEGMIFYLDSLKNEVTNAKSIARLQENGIKLIKKSDLMKLQKASIPVVYSMIRQFYEPLQFLMNEKNIFYANVLKKFAMQFWFLMKAVHTCRLYPDLNDTRQTMDPRYVLDYDNEDHVRYFLSEFDNPKEHFSFTKIMIKNGREMVNKFIEREFRDSQFAALAYVILLVECENDPTIEPYINQQKDQVFTEIYVYFTGIFGSEKGGVKFANLFHMLTEFMVYFRRVHDDITLNKTFLTDFYDAWLDLEIQEKL